MKLTPELFAQLFAATIFLGIVIYGIRGYIREKNYNER